MQLGPWLTNMMRLLTARKTLKQRVRKRTSRAIYNSWKRPYRESLCHPTLRGGVHLGKPVFQVPEDLTLQKELLTNGRQMTNAGANGDRSPPQYLGTL